MSTSPTPIRVVTVEVGHTHVLLSSLEYSTPVSSLAVSGLTSPRALCSRVLQASSASEDVHRVLRVLPESTARASSALGAFGVRCPDLESIECFE